MFELKVKVDFAAAHHLVGYHGNCARPHGHNFVVEVFARSRRLDDVGLAIDFRDLKGAVKELIEPWDHQDLNTLPDFREVNPSAEQIARLSYDRLSAIIDGEHTWIERVMVWENDRCSATYWDERKKR